MIWVMLILNYSFSLLCDYYIIPHYRVLKHKFLFLACSYEISNINIFFDKLDEIFFWKTFFRLNKGGQYCFAFFLLGITRRDWILVLNFCMFRVRLSPLTITYARATTTHMETIIRISFN